MQYSFRTEIKRRLLSVMLIFSAALAVCLVFSELHRSRETEEENRRYRSEHSLFEDIVIGGNQLERDTDSDHHPVPGREESGEEQAVEASRPRQETYPRNAGDGKWEIYVPGDLADQAHIYFRHFHELVLTSKAEEKDGNEDGSGTSITLKSGEHIPESCLESGSVWHVQTLGKKDLVLEEGELVIYCARDVPTLYMNVSSGGTDELDRDKSVREEFRYLVCSSDGSRDVTGRGVIHGRGNSSWKEAKKQYSLNLASGRSVLGMDEARKFALIANTSDPSFLRNKTVFDLAVLSGMPSSPQSVFVNVYFNGQYHGLYLMAQRPNAKDGSVHIAELEKKNREAAGENTDGQLTGTEPAGTEADPGEESVETVVEIDDEGLEIHASPQKEIPDNITGGYLLEVDGRYEGEDYWFSTGTHHFVVKYPTAVPLEECKYIAGYVREAEAALYSEDGINPDTGKSWEEYFDRESWAQMYLMQDFMTQWDVESFSFFVYKDADDPHLYCGPTWDFDLSMGATGLGSLPDVMQRSIWLREHRNGWLTEFEKFPAFSDALQICAEKGFFPVLSEYLSDEPGPSMPGIRDYMTILPSSVKMDARRWKESDRFGKESEKLLSWLQGRAAFYQGYYRDSSAYCKVTLRYGFRDMDIYIPRGEAIGFVPTEEYGEHFYSSFRKKYGPIDGWQCEDGSLLTADTVIDHDQVMTPFSFTQ